MTENYSPRSITIGSGILYRADKYITTDEALKQSWGWVREQMVNQGILQEDETDTETASV